MSSCSKGSRGLSVLPRVIRIFTNNTISPGLWLRQRPSRYAIRAGRNLPDKEFRSICYLGDPLSKASIDFSILLHVAMEVGLYLHCLSVFGV